MKGTSSEPLEARDLPISLLCLPHIWQHVSLEARETAFLSFNPRLEAGLGLNCARAYSAVCRCILLPRTHTALGRHCTTFPPPRLAYSSRRRASQPWPAQPGRRHRRGEPRRSQVNHCLRDRLLHQPLGAIAEESPAAACESLSKTSPASSTIRRHRRGEPRRSRRPKGARLMNQSRLRLFLVVDSSIAKTQRSVRRGSRPRGACSRRCSGCASFLINY